jgi:hypothetical protein
MINAAIDRRVSQAACLLLNKKIARYGRIEKLKIDSKRKTMDIAAVLLGEKEPIGLSVERYEIRREGQTSSLCILACRCELPWLQNLLDDFVRGRPFELPGGFLL